MPHFILDCSDSILDSYTEEDLMASIHHAANSSGLFVESEIKVRINPYKKYSVGNKKSDFIHVFAHIMQGRSTEQKAMLSKIIITKLAELFPDIENLAMNVSDFEKATYCNLEKL
jgi:5-carboxymethyl-2-hydroxymuconate isomerase